MRRRRRAAGPGSFSYDPRARHRCPTTLCVLALDPDVARWCALPMVSGQPGSPFVPLVRTRGLALGDPSPRGIGIRTKTKVRLTLGEGTLGGC